MEHLDIKANADVILLKDYLKEQNIGDLVTYEEMQKELHCDINVNDYVVRSAIDQLKKNEGIFFVNKWGEGYTRVNEADYIKWERKFRVSQRKNSALRSNRYLRKVDFSKLDEPDRKEYYQLQAINALVYELTKKRSQDMINKIDSQTKYDSMRTINILKQMNIG